MITHSEECKRQWNPHVNQLAPWFVQAWHYTCTEACVNERGRNKAGGAVSFPDGGGVLIVPKAITDAPRSFAAELACDNYTPRCGYQGGRPDRTCLNCGSTLRAHELRARIKEDRMVEALRTPIPTTIFTERQAMSHEVRVTNTVIHVVHLDNVVVLDEEDRSTRVLHFETEQEAEVFVSSLAEPDDRDGDRCASTRAFDDEGVLRCDLIRGHDHQHQRGADGSYWTWS